MTYGESSKWDKVIPVIAIGILLAFFACVPSMIKDQNRAEAQQWQAQGCQMYDDYKLSDVPAKCQVYFVDHYQAQPVRVQPPQAQ